MKFTKLIGTILTAGVLFLAAPAIADNAGTPPGDPCSKNNGNPCNGNNGNPGDQGNSNRDKVKIDPTPVPIDIEMPAVINHGAYIEQIGNMNVASVAQTAPRAYAAIRQDGDRNDAEVTQSGKGTAYVDASQTGDGNFARVQQSGDGQNVLFVSQAGIGNWLSADQNAVGAIHNGAVLAQAGNNNDMMLAQDGSDNRAVLTQEGDDNSMTAAQLGDGNRLSWVQQGSNLSDLQITQTGGAAPGGQLSITQTNVGNGH
jgi:hypothetical protein